MRGLILPGPGDIINRDRIIGVFVEIESGATANDVAAGACWQVIIVIEPAETYVVDSKLTEQNAKRLRDRLAGAIFDEINGPDSYPPDDSYLAQ